MSNPKRERLRDKIPLVIDFETHLTRDISLSKMSLRRYIANTHVTWFAMALGNAPTSVFTGTSLTPFLPDIRRAFEHDEVVVVAHNSAFDVRVARYLLGLPFPRHELCTVDLAHAAFPNQPGGYRLENLGKSFDWMPEKREIDLHEGKHTDAEMAAYVASDVECCRALYDACLARIGDEELLLAELTTRSRQLSLDIDHAKGRKALDTFVQQVQDSAKRAADRMEIGPDVSKVFGLDGNKIKSIKPHAVKELLAEQFGFETETISKKKINPTKLAQNTNAAATVEDISVANRGLSHQRRINSMLQDTQLDLNLNYFGSHTGRWTSKSDGKGINFLNLPKHDKLVAPLLRGMISVAGDTLLVRGDAATLEYRMNGWLTDCQHTTDLYGADIFADAYTSFGELATGQAVPKSQRPVWKTTVLGLGFLMGPRTHALNLAKLLADERARAEITGTTPNVTLDTFRDICKQNNWAMPQSPYYKRVRSQTGLDATVIALAHHTHDVFHKIHPEFKLFAEWMGATVRELATSRDPIDTLNRAYARRNAPSPAKVRLKVDDDLQGRSVRVMCGPWYQPTLTWRDIGVRKDAFGNFGLCCVKEGNRGYRQLTPNILIENVVQAAGRNAMAEGMLHMYDPNGVHGYQHILNVHDEVLLAVPDRYIDVLYARDNLLTVYGPGGIVSKKWDWTCVMNPDEINVSRSLWEEDVLDIDPQFWDKLKEGDDSVLTRIP